MEEAADGDECDVMDMTEERDAEASKTVSEDPFWLRMTEKERKAFCIQHCLG